MNTVNALQLRTDTQTFFLGRISHKEKKHAKWSLNIGQMTNANSNSTLNKYKDPK